MVSLSQPCDDPLASASQGAGIIGMSHHAKPFLLGWGSCYVASAVLELLGSVDLPASASVFNILRNYQVAFQSGCSILHLHKQCISIPIVPHAYTCHCLFSYSHPSGCEVVSCVLICISLMTNSVEHLFVYLLTIHISFWEK